MKNFKRREGFGGEDRGERKSYEAVCDKCGKRCEVPFRPTGDRPVFCRDCFGGGRDHRSEGGFRGRRDDRRPAFARPAFTPQFPAAPSNKKEIEDIKKQLDAVHKKLDRIILSIGLQPYKEFPAQVEAVVAAQNTAPVEVPEKKPAKKKKTKK